MALMSLRLPQQLRQLGEGRQLTTAITTAATTSRQQKFPFHVGLSATGPELVIASKSALVLYLEGLRAGRFAQASNP